MQPRHGGEVIAGAAAASATAMERVPMLMLAFRLIAAFGIAVSASLPIPPKAGAESPAPTLEDAVAQARELGRLNAMMVAIDGTTVIEEVFDGPGLDAPVNVKSVAKTFIAALVGAAIERGVLDGTDQRIGPLVGERMPGDAAAGAGDITIGQLLSMQSGLERTSGANYGRWVQSGNWVAHALSRPMVEPPGGRMLYSTGNSHILSAILTWMTGRSTLELARDWLGGPLDIDIPAWDRDPQGIYFGGNNMALSPRAMLALGELYRNGGVAGGDRVFAEDWVEQSWQVRARSPFTGDGYGYGWFLRLAADHDVHYAWGYGGQMIYVVPALGLTAVMTSDADAPSGRSGYARELHALVQDVLIPAVENRPTQRP
jgi:CubicO group peptidase (beta-lactamase class C family)